MMKTTGHDGDAVYMPAELLAEARRAADEEHRAADELVSDAVRRYLEQRKQPERPEDKAERTLLDFFEPIRGLGIELTRNRSLSGPVDL